MSDTDSKIRAPHLYEVDVVRILTFACVIAVHTTSDTIGATDVPLFAVLGILHFTREVFFALSGFVLVYSYLGRPVPMRQFWPRRFLLAGVPYLLWSAIYLFAGTLHAPHLTPLELIGRFIVVVLTGSAWYHLYFLLVTMQVYLLLPAIMWTVKKSRGRHGLVLAVGGVFQLLLMAVYEYWSDMPGWLSAGIQSFFFSYLFFILLGAVAADHATAVLSWTRTHRRAIYFVTVVTAVPTLVAFWVQHAVFGFTLERSVAPLQPILVVWSVAVALSLLAVGGQWADRRRAGSPLARAVEVASDRSFGIFLVHPLVIWALLLPGNDWLPRSVPKPWLTLVAYAIVVPAAWLITEAARRSPLSLPLTGRSWKRPGRAVLFFGAQGAPPD